MRPGRRILLFTALFLCAFSSGPAAQTPEIQGKERTLALADALKRIEVLSGTEAEFRWDPLLRSGTLSAGGHRAAFIAGKAGESGAALVDGADVFTLPRPYLDRGELFFPEAFVSQVGTVIQNRLEDERGRLRIAAIIVDPGHGGRDSGAVGSFTVDGKQRQSIEKDITLKTARFLYDRLSETYRDKRIIMTRTGDTFPSLEQRVSMANEVPLKDNEAVIYISIHANASFDKKAKGYEVWYLSPDYRRNVIDRSKYTESKEVIPILNAMMEEEFTTESILMAQSILKRINEEVGDRSPSRGMKAEEWFVVKKSRMPAVLVELGFVTNESDAALMGSDAYLKGLSEALYKGINDFIALFERSGGFTAKWAP